jgi:hypothetical protein
MVGATSPAVAASLSLQEGKRLTFVPPDWEPARYAGSLFSQEPHAMTAKPFTKIVDYTAEDLEDAINYAVEHCKAANVDFYVILRGIDSYFEKRHRKLNPGATRITSWQGDHSTGDWNRGSNAKQEFPRQGASYGRTTSGGSAQRPLQQGSDPADTDPSSPTPALGTQRTRSSAESAGPTDQESRPSGPNPAVPNGRRDRAGKRRPGPQRAS